MLVGNYDPTLVLTSLAVAILASYTALGMASRVHAARGLAARFWLLGGACAMGLGIWSMHFVGMLAFSLPIALGYDTSLTLLSLLIAVACSAFALWVVSRPALPGRYLTGAALLMGCGIAAMHYVGMEAMRMHPAIQYVPALFALSIGVAVLASGVALWMAHKLRHYRPGSTVYRVWAAMIMGLAIVGMHYTGMAAARFPEGSTCLAALHGISAGWLAISITAITLSVLAIALVVAVLDSRMEARTATLTSSLARANQALRHLALHDPVTNLPNRTLLDERLAQIIGRASVRHTHLAALFIDLDDFHAVNDAYGQQSGDTLLRELAHRMRDTVLGAEDTVAHLGGAEFVVLTELVAATDAAELAQRLIDALSHDVRIDGQGLAVTACVGIAIYPQDGQDGHTLLTHACTAMHHARRLYSTHRFGYFAPAMNEDAREQLLLLQDLRQAHTRGELILHYQPKFQMPNGTVTGAEALLRWNHPTRGMLPPTDFLALAERTGLIYPIGEWVLNEACRQMRLWRDLGHTGWTMAVNLSATQFAQPGLVDSVRDTLARHLLPATCLVIEVTESTVMHDVSTSLAVLRELALLGVAISIDDFGTGYSSLLYLKRLPASELKIDQGFIAQLEHDQEDAAIVSAIIALGQRLNLNVVAEGVETAAQQAFLVRLGCNGLQGSLLGKPLPAQEFLDADFLRNQDA